MQDAINNRSYFWEVISQDEAYLDDVVEIDACKSIFERADLFVGNTPKYKLVFAHLQVYKEANGVHTFIFIDFLDAALKFFQEFDEIHAHFLDQSIWRLVLEVEHAADLIQYAVDFLLPLEQIHTDLLKKLAAFLLWRLLWRGRWSATVLHILWYLNGKKGIWTGSFLSFINLTKAIFVLHIKIIFEIVLTKRRFDNERKSILYFCQFDSANVICDLKAKTRLEERVPSDQLGAEFLQ